MEWQAIDDFEKEPERGFVWIIYKDKVEMAWYETHHQQHRYFHDKYATVSFLPQHITFVQPVVKPEIPREGTP